MPLVAQLREHVDNWKYCWLFEVGSMRNAHLKTVRKLWKEYVLVVPTYSIPTFKNSSARIFFGRSAVMAKALGTTPEEEHRSGLHNLAKAGFPYLVSDYGS
jgi:mRNA turnover protein 4